MDIIAEVNKAIEYSKEKNYSKAEKKYKDILLLCPENSQVLSLLGLLYLDWGYLSKAEKYLNKAYGLKASIPTIEGLAIVKLALKRKDAQDFVEIIIDKTKNFEVFDKSINFLINKNNYSKAAIYAEKCSEIFPLKKEAIANLVNCYINIGKLKEAFNLSLKLTKTYPKYPVGWFLRGLCYEMIFHDDAEAEKCFQNVIKSGDKETGYINLAINAYKTDKYELAIKYLNKLKRIAPANYHRDFIYSIVLFKQRNFKKAIKYYSEYIHKNSYYAKRISKNFVSKIWDGKTYRDETLFVYGDQGVGDIFMFSRYLPFLSKKFKSVKVLVRENIIDIYKNSFKKYKNISFCTKSTSKYDKSAIMSCLPYYLKKDYTSIPFSEGYLKVLKKNVDFYKKIINSEDLKVGICWEAGASGLRGQINRTLHISVFEDILKMKNLQCYSLQVNPSLDNYKDYKNLVDLGSDFKNFSDTAGALKNLDLVITVDTSVAHLAGALGVKTFLLLPYCPDWRWFDDDKTTGWYDSVRMFKQKEPKSWDDVFRNILKELEKIK